MAWFGTKTLPTDVVTKISVFPKIATAVLKKGQKLVVFNPRYLLGKHSTGSEQVASKFTNLQKATQLLELIDAYVTDKNLTGSKIEIKEIDFGSDLGNDALVTITPELNLVLPKENVRGNTINIIFTDKKNIPKTRLLNIILLPFNPAYGDGVDQLFKQKYSGLIGFENFEVYAIVTIYPGKYAPPMTDKTFWDQHALLKEFK